MTIQNLVVLGVLVGGSLGALARLGAAVLLQRLGSEPWVGTFAVNAGGCFLFGLCWSLHGGGWPRPVAAAVFTGFLGAFTTFSTYAFECIELWDRGRHLACALYAAGQNAIGALGMLGGLWLGRGP